MPKVYLIPYNQYESVCKDAVKYANSCQREFKFDLLPRDDNTAKILDARRAEVEDILKRVRTLNPQLQNHDTVLAFFDGILETRGHELTNLFLAGSRYDEEPPCTAIVSLKYLQWDILEAKYDYQVQQHSLLHLIVCAIIGSYTKLKAHENVGCLLDFNADLRSFNLKIQRGYYLCSEYGCYEKIRQENFGDAILRLCERFKAGTNYQTIINQFMGDNIEGDKIEVGNISNNFGRIVIGKNITIKNGKDDDRSEAADRLSKLIDIIRAELKLTIDQQQTLITNFDKIREELVEENPDTLRITKWLSSIRSVAEKVVLSHEATQAIQWVYSWFGL